MIAKFNTGDGWSFIECGQVNTLKGSVKIDEHIKKTCLLFGHNDETKEANRVTLIGKENKGLVVLYCKEAYLMNDEGNTICAL